MAALIRRNSAAAAPCLSLKIGAWQSVSVQTGKLEKGVSNVIL